jgi:hypothetical protein
MAMLPPFKKSSDLTILIDSFKYDKHSSSMLSF